MIRTVISLPEDDKRWLDEQAERESTTMTELVRRAVTLLRQSSEHDQPTFDSLLDRSSNIWTEGDGLDYQKRSRHE